MNKGLVFASLTLLSIILPAGILPAQAANELIVNGGFENGNISGWTLVGSVYVSRFAHAGGHSLRIGQRFGFTVLPGQISQQFKLPTGTTGTLSFWYNGGQGYGHASQLTITLLDQDGTIIGQWQAKLDYLWHQITSSVDLKYSGRELTLRFFGQGDFVTEYFTRQCGPRTCIRVILVPVYVYVDDISVTYP